MKELAYELIDKKCVITCMDPEEPLTEFTGVIERITEDAILLNDTDNVCYHVINWRYIMEINIPKTNSPEKEIDLTYIEEICGHCLYWNKNGTCRQDNARMLSNTNACSMFSKKPEPKPNPEPRPGCFLTSACVSHRGLPDDCEELTILRNFRDQYLKQSAEGTELVKFYYKIAPEIVRKIEQSSEKDSFYDEIYTRIRACVEMIKKEQFQETRNLYISMVRDLLEKLDMLPVITVGNA